jgi:hypothetical protein
LHGVEYLAENGFRASAVRHFEGGQFSHRDFNGRTKSARPMMRLLIYIDHIKLFISAITGQVATSLFIFLDLRLVAQDCVQQRAVNFYLPVIE